MGSDDAVETIKSHAEDKKGAAQEADEVKKVDHVAVP